MDKNPRRIAGMFDAIAGRYDLLNHLLSAGLDRRWRRRAVGELGLSGRERVLDLCSGTGDLAITAIRSLPPAARVIGVDFAGEMLRKAREKLQRLGLNDRVALVRGDAMAIPVASRCADAAMVGFGIRNVQQPKLALAELRRVLKAGGRLVILEFGFPRIYGIRTLYGWYFRYLLPRVGRTISKHHDAYSYLPESVSAFHSPGAFSDLMAQAGFVRVRAVPLTFGIVYMFMAERGPDREP